MMFAEGRRTVEKLTVSLSDHMGSPGFLTNPEGSFSIHVSRGDGVHPNRRNPQADDASFPEAVPAKGRIFVEAPFFLKGRSDS